MTPRSRTPRCCRALGGAAVAVGLVLGSVACSSGSPGNITDRTVPPVTPPGSDVAPTRTVPPAGTGPHSTVGTTKPGAGGGRGTATINDFTIPNKVSCDLGRTVSLTAIYDTDGASAVVFVLDGDTVKGSPRTSGSFDLDIPCDGNAHTLVLTAVDDDGGTTVASKAILTNVAPVGD